MVANTHRFTTGRRSKDYRPQFSSHSLYSLTKYNKALVEYSSRALLFWRTVHTLTPLYNCHLSTKSTFFCFQDGRYGEVLSVVFLSFRAISDDTRNPLRYFSHPSSPSNIEKCSRCLARKQERLNTGYSPHV